MILLLFVVSFFILPKEEIIYFENDKIQISYEEILCEDIKNGVSFEYYQIKVENKTKETLVINFYLGEADKKTEENKVAFVLNPFETKVGSCSYQPIKLMLFKNERLTHKSTTAMPFNLNNIETFEVY